MSIFDILSRGKGNVAQNQKPPIDLVKEAAAMRLREQFVDLCARSVPIVLPQMRQERYLNAPGEFVELCKHPLLQKAGGQNIAIKDDWIIIQTPFICAHGRRLGNYLVTLNPITKEHRVWNLWNLGKPEVERDGGGYMGPHINPSGLMCFGIGGGHTQYTNALASGHLQKALFVMFHIMTHIHNSGAYGPAKLENWADDIPPLEGVYRSGT